jgi:hypothetical protein
VADAKKYLHRAIDRQIAWRRGKRTMAALQHFSS